MLIHFKKQLAEKIKQAIISLAKSGKLNLEVDRLPEVVIEIPANSSFGEFSTPVALQLAKAAQNNPRKIAEMILAELFREVSPFWEDFTALEIEAGRMVFKPADFLAGPGFINFTMKDKFWATMVKIINEQGAGYGSSDYGQKRKVMVEFVSANPTGPLHIGHGRSAAYGDSLARVLRLAGFDVWREYYINDAGRQMGLLGKSLHARYLQELGVEASLPAEGYRGRYLVEIAKQLKNEQGDKYRNEAADSEFFINYAVEMILAGIRSDLAEFKVEFDHWFSEKRELHDTNKVEECLEYLKSRKAVYQKDGAAWLKTGEWEEQDRVVVNSQGVPTYLAGDIAYHKNKYERGFETLIDIWGHDHHGYQPRMKAMVEALGYSPDSLHLIVYQLVSLLRDGAPVKMSTRAGEFITLKEVLDEVGSDAVRYFFNMRGPDSQMEFDLELAKKQSSDNPVFYVQYAHARICSIFRNMAEYGFNEADIPTAKVDLLTTEGERDLIKKLAAFPELVIKCAKSDEPHHLTTYLQEMAAIFHSFYKHHRIMDRENQELSYARLKLMKALKIVIHNGLDLLGVTAPERM